MNVKLILKGFIVGIGKIIPGISGAMLAITLGIYERLINSVTNFFSDIKENSYLLFNFGLGVILAIILFSKLILFLLHNYYDEVMYLFLGLVIGTLIPFIKTLKFNIKNTLITIISFFFTIYLITFKGGNTFIFNGRILDYIYTAFLGLIDAFTSIIPGISGTVIYMIMGSYEYVLSLLSNPTSINFIVYIIGLIIGIIFVAYLINFIFKKWKNEAYMIFLGLMLGSLGILLVSIINKFNIYLCLYLIIGIIIGTIFDK